MRTGDVSSKCWKIRVKEMIYDQIPEVGSTVAKVALDSVTRDIAWLSAYLGVTFEY
jgi:hypothetical protein